VVSGEIGVVVRQSLFLCPNPSHLPTPKMLCGKRITYAKQYAGWDGAHGEKII
jgi:hypothetical protein